MINALIYEIYHSQNPVALMNQFLNLIDFPLLETSFQLDSVTTYIEQSFSDFGDTDLLLLIDNQGNKQGLFLEAKVKTGTKHSWSIHRELNRFRDKISNFNSIDSSSHSPSDFPNPSNLFNQLYRKNMLVNGLKEHRLDYIQYTGLVFPGCDPIPRNRKLGRNERVIRAAEHLIHYLEESFFVALVPNLNGIDLKELLQIVQNIPTFDAAYKSWQFARIGFITWEQVHHFSEVAGLKHSIDMFEFNKGQIY